MLWVYAANAQQYLMRNFSIQDGLSHANVYRIFQDRKGFLWFCTDYGLCSYNGQVFNTNFADKEGLLNDAVMSVSEDSAGVKYINTYKRGLLVLTDSSLKRYSITEGAYPSFSLHAVRDKYTTWIVSKMGLFRLTGSRISKYNIRDKYGKDVVFNRLTRAGGDLLLCGSNGIYCIKDSIVVPFMAAGIIDTTVAVCGAGNGKYYVALKHKILLLGSGKVAQTYVLPPNQLIKTILYDRQGNLWVALDGEGMLLLQNGILRNITTLLSLNKTVVNDMLEDNEGNIWLATYGAGVFKIGSTNVLAYQPGGSNSNIYCRALCSYGGDKILIGSVGKVSLWNEGVITQVNLNLLHVDNYVYFVSARGSRIFIGTSDGLIVYDSETKRERKIKYEKFYAAIAFCADDAGYIWIGDYTGLYKLKDEQLYAATPVCAGVHRYNAICQDRDGSMWYATDTGLIHANSNGVPAIWLNGVQINDVAADPHGRIWVATNDGSGYIWNNKLKLFTKEDGLASNKCNKLLVQGERLWIATLSGLTYVDLSTLHIEKYVAGPGKDDILSLCGGSDGKLFAGTASKLISMRVADAGPVNAPPPVYITFARTATAQTNMPTELKLAYNDNKLTIGFIGLSYSEPYSVEYRYRIEGLQDSWYTTRSTLIELQALPSGQYTFVLNARKNDGSWGGDARMIITVATPVWKTWWFITVAALACITLLMYTVRKRTIRQEWKRRKQLQQYSKIVYLKQQALSALINPHFIFNCMNSIQYYLDNNENDKANSYLTDFAQLIRMTMEDAQKVWISLDNELARIRLYLSLEQLRFGEKLTYEIHVAETLDLLNTYIPNMVLQPYIENAIWHGIMPKEENGIINITFMPHGEQEIKICISDNGGGIPEGCEEQETGGHYGMKLTKERLELLKALSGENYEVQATQRVDAQGNVAGTLIEVLITARPADISLRRYEDEEQ